MVMCVTLVAMVLAVQALPATVDGHTHQFEITVDGSNVATVKCTAEGCNYGTNTEYTAAVLILANKSYDGTPIEVEVSKSEGFPTEIQFTTQYEGIEGTTYGPSPTAPSDAGHYKATTTISPADQSLRRLS